MYKTTLCQYKIVIIGFLLLYTENTRILIIKFLMTLLKMIFFNRKITDILKYFSMFRNILVFRFLFK